MYPRPKFLEVLLEIRCEMAREADYDVDLLAEMVRTGALSGRGENVADPDADGFSNEPELQADRERGSSRAD